MMNDTILSIDLISTNPAVRKGRPIIAGTGLTVSDVAIAKILHGKSADEIAEWYGLSLPRVYAALAFYYEHKAEIDADIKQREETADAMKEKRIGSRHSPLFG
jgi:uncharacterized protein (DUF433 family)